MNNFVCNNCGNIYGPFGACPKCLSQNVTKIEDNNMFTEEGDNMYMEGNDKRMHS